MTSQMRIDALLPVEMAKRAEYLGVRKADASILTTFTLAILAGAFIAMGAIFATTVAAGTSAAWPFAVTKLITGMVFCLAIKD